MDQFAEFGHGVLFTLHQRRTGKADVTGVGENSPHLGCHGTIVGAVALVDENENITGVVLGIQPFCGNEFIDDAGNHISLAAGDQLHQMSAAGGTGRVQPGMSKRGCDLTVQFLTIGNDYHTGIAGCQLHQDVFRQHDHRQALAAALGMPDDTALPVSLGILLLNGLYDLLNGEILLITGDLLHIGIEQNEIAHQLHDPLPAQQRDDVSVLLRGQSIRHQILQGVLCKGFVFLFPHIPELLGRAGGGILDCILIGRHDDLSILEQLGDVLGLLVADVLLHGLVHGDMGSLALDDRKGNAVDKQHNIRAGIMPLILAVYGEFLGHME